MAKISMSPLIVDIRNKVADAVFAKWKGVNYVRSRVVPANPKTTAQTEVREALARLVNLYQTMNNYARLNLVEYMKGKNATGFNFFIGKNLVDERAGNLITLTMLLPASTTLTTFTPSTGAGAGEIDVAFTPAIGTGDLLEYHCRKVGTDEWQKLGNWTQGQTSPQTITGLDAGASYQVYGYMYDASEGGEEVSQSIGGLATAHA